MIKTSPEIASKFLSKVCVANFQKLNYCFSQCCETVKKVVPKIEILLTTFYRRTYGIK